MQDQTGHDQPQILLCFAAFSYESKTNALSKDAHKILILIGKSEIQFKLKSFFLNTLEV
jgi:hypothetical protein